MTVRRQWADLQVRKREQLVELMERGALKRLPRTRPRDPEEEHVLSLLVRLRWKQWRESGKVEFLHPRRWRLRLENESSTSLR